MAEHVYQTPEQLADHKYAAESKVMISRNRLLAVLSDLEAMRQTAREIAENSVSLATYNALREERDEWKRRCLNTGELLLKADKERERVQLYFDDAEAELDRLRKENSHLSDKLGALVFDPNPEVERLRKALEDKPHDAECRSLIKVRRIVGRKLRGEESIGPCDCRKSRALNHQPEAKPTPPTLDSLIEMARDHVAKMSPEEKAEARRLQVISFAWGNVHLHNPDVTYAMVEQEYDRMFGAGR